jgi:hypothetical protein
MAAMVLKEEQQRISQNKELHLQNQEKIGLMLFGTKI